VETEKFLFYRGLGQFTLPIRAEVKPGAQITLANDGADPIRHLFVVHVREGRAEFTYLPDLPARGSVSVERPISPKAGNVAGMLKTLMPLMEEKLVAEGLYAKEAEAMVRTWERSYFHAEGLRVLYVVPERVTHELLPIAISPAPDEMKRVLVGRLECITPEVEAEVERALRTMDRARLEKCGRFLEPHVRRVLAKTDDDIVRKNAEDILKGGRR